MLTVEGAGVLLAVEERGAGPQTAVVVHGMASDRLGWAGPLERLAAAGMRALAYDRRGYGDSGAPQPYGATTVEEQAEDLVALLDGLAVERAVLLGDGFGALVALDALKRHPRRVSAAVLLDAPLLAFVPDAAQALAAQRERLEDALREDGAAAAVALWLGDDADPAALRRAQAASGAFFADYAGQATWSVSRRELRAMDRPIAVLTRPDASARLEAAADALAALLPDVRREAGGDAVDAALALRPS